MKIAQNEFEQFTEEQILGRGLRYFEDGAVRDFTELGNGEYEATVSGSQNYNVQLEIINNDVVKYRCDRPYDLDPICKHVVAVIFYAQQDSLKQEKKYYGLKNKKIKIGYPTGQRFC